MLSLRIALRYLLARKTHAAVNVITLISMAGVAVAAMAMVCVLSVFNGFARLAASRLSALDPAVLVEPARQGGLIEQADSLTAILRGIDCVAAACPVIEQRALAVSAEGDQMPVRVRGVADGYSRVSGLGDILIDGEFADTPAMEHALLSVGVAIRTGARPSPVLPFVLTAPRRLGRINPALPLSAFSRDTLCVSGVYQSDQAETDDDLVYVPIATARHLFDYPTQATSIHLALKGGTGADEASRLIASAIGPGYKALTRLEQQSEAFRMIEVEKWITFLMLVFVLVMASFNILSTMQMLIIEKENDMSTLRSLGASGGMVKGIFRWEGMLVAWAGGTAGLLTGIALCLLQQHFGLISLGGDPASLSITSYPCHLAWGDLLLTAAIVTAIGFFSGLFAARQCGGKA